MSTATTTRPILFLAFANDPAHPLPRLADELRGVRAALAPALDAGLCELVEEPYATAEGILAAFRRQRDRIAIFHFAGHAGSDRLLLEAAGGGGQAADANGLAAFLAQKHGLALVFLNGCSTRDQVQGLLDAGVAAVIATSQAIRDDVAAEFACQFYTGLAAGRDLRAAFDEAVGALRAMRGSSLRDLFDEDASDVASGEPPWALYERAGADAATGWSLPVAANDPLFGLPDLPSLDLPKDPFRYLAPYGRADAPIFFGRSRDIRRQYDRITAPDSDPILLLFGQSGVGKSSLLDAGLRPRLERDYGVVYARRSQALGLVGTLHAALQPSSTVQDNPQSVGPAAAWQAAEARNGKPLIVILDQLEEVESRPFKTLAVEIEAFMVSLRELFVQPAKRPRGRLILGFRAEFLFKVKKWLDDAGLPYNDKGILEPLDRDGLVEIVEGPASTPALQRKYALTLAPGLSTRIADDLINDAGSPVAPTLQVLLSEMWRSAMGANPAQPHFTQELYSGVQRNRYLDAFLGQQLEALHASASQRADDGLALDLLDFHVTDQVTAAQHPRAEIEALYRHRPAIWSDLVLPLRNSYLLADSRLGHGDGAEATRLAHDALAPLVRERFNNSTAPGRQARRILENRAKDWEGGNVGPPLDASDLKRVEAGVRGMRAWTAAEQRLVQASRTRHRSQRRERALALVALIVLTGIALWALWQVVRPTYLRGQVANASPAVRIDAIEIDRNEVSIALYAKCYSANSQRCPAPIGNEDFGRYSDGEEEYGGLPVTNITAVHAQNFCAWIGRRLPTLAEWETSTLQFEAEHIGPIPDRRITYEPSINIGPDAGTVWPVAKRSVDDLQENNRALNLIGNVWEWTCTSTEDSAASCWTDYKAVWFVGGGHELRRKDLKLENLRGPASPFEPSEYIGFRCVLDSSKR